MSSQCSAISYVPQLTNHQPSQFFVCTAYIKWLPGVQLRHLEEGGGSPTATGLLGSSLLFIQEKMVGNCSPNLLQMSWDKESFFLLLLIYTTLTNEALSTTCAVHTLFLRVLYALV